MENNKLKKCPNCDFENPYDVEYCLCCGYKPYRMCPACFSWNNSALKCKDCGAKIDPMARFGDKLHSLDPKTMSSGERLSKIGGALLQMGKEVYQGEYHTQKYFRDINWMKKVRVYRAQYKIFSFFFGLIALGFTVGFAISVTIIFFVGLAINAQFGFIFLFVYAISGAIFLFVITLPKIKTRLKAKYLKKMPAIDLDLNPMRYTPLPQQPLNRPPIINN